MSGRMWATALLGFLALDGLLGCTAIFRVGEAPASGAAPVLQRPAILDSFESTTGWRALPASGSAVRIASDSGFRGRSLRLDLDVPAGGSALVRKAFGFSVPANFELSFRIRGDLPPSALTLRLVDQTGRNVWTSTQHGYRPQRAWTEVVRKRRHFTYVSRVGDGGSVGRVAAIEIGIVTAKPARGTVWIDELQLRAREPDRPYALTPNATASSESGGFEAYRALDGDTSSAWRPAAGAGTPNAPHALVIDFKRSRELGGITVDWEPGRRAADYTVDYSADGATWVTRYHLTGGDGGRDHIFLPESDTRYIRLSLQSGPGEGFGIREVRVQPLEWSASSDAFFAAIAKTAPPGSYPKRLSGGQSYWTVTGADGDEAEVLIDEEGRVEGGAGTFSIEPFVYADGKLFTWRDVTIAQSLGGGHFLQPVVTWDGGDWQLTVRPAVKAQRRDSSAAYLGYELTNRGRAGRTFRLYLALRPFRVIAPRRDAASAAEPASIHDVSIDDGIIRIDDRAAVITITPHDGFGAATFDQGNIVELLRGGALPASPNAKDAAGHASAALAYATELDTAAVMSVEVAMPLHAAAIPGVLAHRASRRDAQPGATSAPRSDAANGWRDALERVAVELPPSASRVVNSLYANLGYMLVHRDGAALQSGSRALGRSRIRDGALQAATLLRLGRADVVREYLEWYARLQLPNGSTSCCIGSGDAGGAPDLAAHGAFIHLAVEYWWYTQDRGTADRMWPQVARGVTYIDSLRHQRMTPEYQSGDKRVFYGILPPTLGRAGSSAGPAHAYEDDFITLRALKDAVELARALSRPEEAQLVTIRDEFRRDLYASIQLAMIQQRIDFVPSTADRGDYDPAAASIAISPGGELGLMPETIARALDRTFERYWEELQNRRNPTTAWVASTASDLAALDAMVRRGERDHAQETLAWLLDRQRPAGWLQWPEVIWRDAVDPGLAGDMPSARAGAAYIGSLLDMFAYERDADSSLVVAAGVPEAWVSERPGVTVRRLATHYGLLSFTIRGERGGARVSMQAGTRIPPGGIIVHSPFTGTPREALVNGVVTPTTSSGGVVVRALPAEVLFRQ